MSLLDLLKTDIAHKGGDIVKSASGDLDTVSSLANYKLALFHRLITTPGAYVHRPQYGVGIELYQNGLASFSKQQELASKIKEQFMEDPRTESVKSVAVLANDSQPALTIIRVSVKPVGYSEVTMSFIPFAGDIA